MVTYVTAFIFYTLAMIGIMLIGFIVYKKTFMTNKGVNNGVIKVVDSLPIGNKKMLLVVKIKDEKFLIASGLEHTTFLSKLEDENSAVQIKEQIFTTEVVQEPVAFKTVQMQNETRNIQPEVRYDDVQKSRAAELQRRFRELYEREEIKTPKIDNITMTKKEKIKRLLKNMNQDTNASYRSRV